MNFFLSEYMDQHFTRLIVVSAGKYAHDTALLEKRISVVVLSTADDLSAPAYARLSPDREGVFLPTAQLTGGHIKISC